MRSKRCPGAGWPVAEFVPIFDASRSVVNDFNAPINDLNTMAGRFEPGQRFECRSTAVAGHHDRYSHSPGYSALEIYGAEPTPLTDIAAFPGGFRAGTSDGQATGSPNDS